MEKIWFYENATKRREGIKKQCNFCKQEFVSPKKAPYSCCSAECKNKLRALKGSIKCVCSNCGKEFSKRKSHLAKSKSGFHFCSRPCKEKAQSLGGIKEIMPFHYGTAKGRRTRSVLLNHLDRGLICEACGEKREFLICLHHIDGNTANNADENIEAVCVACHVIRHLKQTAEGKWVYDSRCLTPRDKLHEFYSEVV